MMMMICGAAGVILFVDLLLWDVHNTVDGFNRTGIPNALWELVEPHSRIDSAKGTALLAVVILVLSNVASNVPTGITPES
jgi:Na+/H+ antiporter NhaD/arsenite permease-like protein